jgi:hypothetical protein
MIFIPIPLLDRVFTARPFQLLRRIGATCAVRITSAFRA